MFINFFKVVERPYWRIIYYIKVYLSCDRLTCSPGCVDLWKGVFHVVKGHETHAERPSIEV